MNLVERWFSALNTHHQEPATLRPRLRRPLSKDIIEWFADRNDDPKPFVWHETADEILERLGRYCADVTKPNCPPVSGQQKLPIDGHPARAGDEGRYRPAAESTSDSAGIDQLPMWRLSAEADHGVMIDVEHLKKRYGRSTRGRRCLVHLPARHHHRFPRSQRGGKSATPRMITGLTPPGSVVVTIDGMRQRLGIGTALLGDPAALILDEPVNGMDPDGIRWIRRMLREFADAGGTALLSSHLLAEVSRDHLPVRGSISADATIRWLWWPVR